MSLDTQTAQQWLDIGTLNAKIVVDLRGMVQASAFLMAAPNGLGTATIEIKKSFDGGVTGVSYGTPKMLTVAAPAQDDVDVDTVPYWVIQTTAASGTSDRVLIRVFASATPSVA